MNITDNDEENDDLHELSGQYEILQELLLAPETAPKDLYKRYKSVTKVPDYQAVALAQVNINFDKDHPLHDSMYELNSQDMLKKFTDPSLFLTKWLQEQERKETLLLQDKNRVKAEKNARRGSKRNKMEANTRASRENSLGFAANYKSVRNTSISSSGDKQSEHGSDKSNPSNDTASVATPGPQQATAPSSPIAPVSPIIVPEDEASEYNRQSIVFQLDANSSARQSLADNSDRPDSFSSSGSHHQRIKVSVVSLSTDLTSTDNNVRVQRAGSSAVTMNKNKSKSKSKDNSRRGLFSALGLSSLSSSVVEESEEEIDEEADEESEGPNQAHATASAGGGGGTTSHPELDDYDLEVTLEDPADDSDDGIEVAEEAKSESTSSSTMTPPPTVPVAHSLGSDETENDSLVPVTLTPNKLDKDDEEVLRVISPDSGNSKSPSSLPTPSDKTKDEKAKELTSKLSVIKMTHNNNNSLDMYSPTVRFAESDDDATTTPVRDQRRSLSRSSSGANALETAEGSGKSLASADTKRRSLSAALEALASSRAASSKDTFNRVEPLAIRLEELNKSTDTGAATSTSTPTTPGSASDKGTNGADPRPKFSPADLMKQIEARAANPRPVSSNSTQVTPRQASSETNSSTNRQVTSTSSNVNIMSNKPVGTSSATSNSAAGTAHLKSPTHTKNVIQNKMFAQILSGQSNLKKVDMQTYLDRKKQQPSLGGFGKSTEYCISASCLIIIFIFIL